MAGEHAEEPDDTRRLGIDILISLGVILAMVAWSRYFHTEPALLGRDARSVLAMLASLGLFQASGGWLYSYETRIGPLQISRFVTAAAGIYLLAGAWWDLVTLLHLPVFPLGFVAFGAVALSGSLWSESMLLAMLGAELVDQVAAFSLAAWLGLGGGYGGEAVWAHIAVALLEMPLGLALARRYRRSLGLGILVNGGYSLLWGFLVAGAHGPVLLGRESWTWISFAFFALALATSILIVRLVASLKDRSSFDLSSRTIILTVSYILGWAGIPNEISFLAAMMAYWALASSGILEPRQEGGETLELDGDDPEALQRLLIARLTPDPSAARPEPDTQGRWLLAHQVSILAIYLLAGTAGMLNTRWLASPDLFRMPIPSTWLEPEVHAVVEAIELAEGLPRGAAIDAWLEPSEASGNKIAFSRMVVVPRGAPPPEGMPADGCWKIPGRTYDYLRTDGVRRRGVTVTGRFSFELPASWVTDLKGGETLVFRRGALGMAFPHRIEPAPPSPPDDPEGPDDPDDPDDPGEDTDGTRAAASGWLGRP